MTPNIAGHIGYLFCILGMILIAKKYRIGWLLRIIGQLIWIVVGLTLGLNSIYIWGSIFLLIDFLGFRAWKKI